MSNDNNNSDISSNNSSSPDKTVDGENDLMASICSDESNESFDRPFDNIKNQNIKKCLTILADKIDELTDINNFLSRNNTLMLNRIISLEDNNKKLNNEIKEMQNYIDEINDGMYYIERDIIKNAQYTRRESLIISGIPDNVPQRNLEPTALKIIQALGLKNISSYEVVACHRLADNNDGRYPQKTIIRFTNRKAVNFCLKNRKNHHLVKEATKLNVRFYENLCEKNDFIYRECKRLKISNQIDDSSVSNGFVKITKDEGDKTLKIHHPDDLFDLFVDFYDQNATNGGN